MFQLVFNQVIPQRIRLHAENIEVREWLKEIVNSFPGLIRNAVSICMNEGEKKFKISDSPKP